MKAYYKSTPFYCGTCARPLKFRVRSGFRTDAVYVHAPTLRYRCANRRWFGPHTASNPLRTQEDVEA